MIWQGQMIEVQYNYFWIDEMCTYPIYVQLNDFYY